MTALYPRDPDTFRVFVDDTDVLVAADLGDLYDALIAMEIELGVNPAKAFGSLYGLLFATGRIDAATGYWRRLFWQNARIDYNGTAGEKQRQFSITWPGERFTGQTHEFGEDQGFPFLAVQSDQRGEAIRNFELLELKQSEAVLRVRAGDSGAGQQTRFVGMIIWNL